MKKIYFDESGNTGPDLLNTEQPVYILCSTELPEEVAQQYLSKYFTGLKKIHFKNMKNAKSNQKKILNFLTEYIEEIWRHSKISIFHKEFTITCKMLDYLVEPYFYERGIDFYDEGRNICYSNMFFYTFYSVLGRRDLNEMCSLFLKLITEKSDTTINNFYTYVKHITDHCNSKYLKNELEILLNSRDQIYDLIKYVNRADFDPALSSLIFLIHKWMDEDNEGLEIVHDRSVTIDKRSNDINFLREMTNTKTRVGYGQVTAEYPLNIKNFEFTPSNSSPSIQICDIIASSLCFAYKNPEQDKLDFHSELVKKLTGYPIDNIIWPSTNISLDENRRKKTGDINPIDYLAEQMQKNNYKKNE